MFEIKPELLAELKKTAEVEFYCLALILMYLIKIKESKKAKLLSEEMLTSIDAIKKRHLDSL